MLKSWMNSKENVLRGAPRSRYRRRTFCFERMTIFVKSERRNEHCDRYFSVEQINNYTTGFHPAIGYGFTLKEAFTEFRNELKNPVKISEEDNS